MLFNDIPTGVVNLEIYENVDIDVERAPNASTNALTLENGDVLLFEIEVKIAMVLLVKMKLMIPIKFLRNLLYNSLIISLQ